MTSIRHVIMLIKNYCPETYISFACENHGIGNVIKVRGTRQELTSLLNSTEVNITPWVCKHSSIPEYLVSSDAYTARKKCPVEQWNIAYTDIGDKKCDDCSGIVYTIPGINAFALLELVEKK